MLPGAGSSAFIPILHAVHLIMSSRLLSLPRELRDIILEFVISAHVEPPRHPESDDTPRKASVGSNCLRIPVLPPAEQYATHGLLLTNRQLHHETKTRLRRPTAYFLDVMMVNDKELWPTWTCCPARSKESIAFIGINVRETRDRPALYLKRLHNILLNKASFTGLVEYIADICCPGHQIRKLGLNLLIPTSPERAPHVSTVQLDWFGWQGRFIQRDMRPVMSKEDIMNNESLALRLLAYRMAFFLLSVEITVSELNRVGFKPWAGGFDKKVIIVDGDKRAELERRWEGIHDPHVQSATDALNHNDNISGAISPSTPTNLPPELGL